MESPVLHPDFGERSSRPNFSPPSRTSLSCCHYPEGWRSAGRRAELGWLVVCYFRNLCSPIDATDLFFKENSPSFFFFSFLAFGKFLFSEIVSQKNATEKFLSRGHESLMLMVVLKRSLSIISSTPPPRWLLSPPGIFFWGITRRSGKFWLHCSRKCLERLYHLLPAQGAVYLVGGNTEMLQVRANREIPKTPCQLVLYYDWPIPWGLSDPHCLSHCGGSRRNLTNLVWPENFTPRSCAIEDMTAPLRPEAVLQVLPGSALGPP